MTVEITEDGSATLRSPLHGDTYHSLRGAGGEARHVFIESGFSAVGASSAKRNPCPDERDNSIQTCAGGDTVRVLEMGFGTGLNAWLTLSEAGKSGRRVEYTAVELYPVAEKVAEQLGYTDDRRFMALHRAPWGEWTEPAEGFKLLKLNSDFAVTEFPGKFDAVYYDAFAPDTQPELWTAEIFTRLFGAMSAGGVLVTYSAKGDVRRALQAAGFTVEKLPGALGKRHMLRAMRTNEK